jgi:hypothetical protein
MPGIETENSENSNKQIKAARLNKDENKEN